MLHVGSMNWTVRDSYSRSKGGPFFPQMMVTVVTMVLVLVLVMLVAVTVFRSDATAKRNFPKLSSRFSLFLALPLLQPTKQGGETENVLGSKKRHIGFTLVHVLPPLPSQCYRVLFFPFSLLLGGVLSSRLGI